MKSLVKENKIVFIYAAFAVALEFTSAFFVGARPFFTNFWIPLLLILVPLFGIMSAKSQKFKRVFTLILLIFQVIAIFASGYLYAANGSAFQKEMLYQRDDALGTIEQLNINIWLVLLCVAALVAYSIILRRIKKKAPMIESADRKTLRVVCFTLCLVCACVFSISPILNGAAEKKQPNYYYKLNNAGNGNQKYGMTSNIVYELLRFSGSAGINLEDIDKVDDFIYSSVSPTSDYHGVSDGNNLLFILAESFDSHVLERYTTQENALIFPNITKMMDDGIYCSNFRQKEKTDVSEVFSLLGSYPTEKYVNYSYEKNSYPFSLPNLFKQNATKNGADEPQMLSFHQNQGSFYNRNEVHANLGFQDFVSIEDMVPYGMVNDWDLEGRLTKGERSLDSLTAETMKDVMLPADKQFFSYWITFTMHGFYEERENLTQCGYYDVLDSYDLFPKGTKEENYWRTYAAAVMDFDKALGTIMDDLESKNILDKTTIVVMPDHNTYYNSLTEYTKNLTNKLDPEGFRLPLIIYDQKLAAAFDQKQGPAGTPRIISKFVTGSDIMPTVCDLFGIKLWNNLFIGSTVFDDSRQTIVYSRIYNFFFDDRVAFYTLDNIDYAAEDFTDADMQLFLQRARTLLDKMYYIDKIYYSDYFKDHIFLSP